jgi:hypothetical protein
MQADLEYKIVTYTCTKCNRESKMSLPCPISPNKIKLEKKGFCSNRYCDASHHFYYTGQLPKGKEEYKLKISMFLIDDVEQKVKIS